MGVSDLRVQKRTNDILKQYLCSGVIPDEYFVQQQLEQELTSFYNAATDSFAVNTPLWIPSNLAYRQTSDFRQWNGTQAMASEDMEILYEDFMDQIQILTNNLNNYLTSSNRIQVKLQKLTSRIQDLLLLSSATNGYTYSFFDGFFDTSKTSFAPPFPTTAIVNPENQTVQISPGTTTALNGTISTTTSSLNLLFLQPSDVSCIFLNNVSPSDILPLNNNTSPIGGGGSLVGILNNQANTWQEQVTINGNGPLVAQLTVNVSPIDPVTINKVTVRTKMIDANSQVLIQVLYSPDGISYFGVPSANGTQVVIGSAEFNFAPVQAKSFRFIVTKTQADKGSTYDIGFQYIGFQQCLYDTTGDDFYSIPITIPGNGPINKVALETCETTPAGTGITYGIIIPQASGYIEIPISTIDDTNPQNAQELNISSYTQEDILVNTSGSPYSWMPTTSGLIAGDSELYLDLTTIASGINIGDSSIPQTMVIHRNIGGSVSIAPSGNMGFQVNPSGLPGPGYFLTYDVVNNVNGYNMITGNSNLILDNTLATGTVFLGEGIHSIATQDFDTMQLPVSLGSDQYFAYNMTYVSPWDFTNNVASGDMSYFTYDASTGYVFMNAIPSGILAPNVDYANSFVAYPTKDGTYSSDSTGLNIAVSASGIATASNYINITIDPSGAATQGRWVNEIDISNATFSVNPSAIEIDTYDGISWTTDIVSTDINLNGVQAIVSFRFPTPVYAKIVRIKLTDGINFSVGSVAVYGPRFIIPNTVQSLPIYLPTGTQWKTITNTLQFDTNQTVDILSKFDNSSLGIYGGSLSPFNTGNSWTRDISGVTVPAIILIASNNDPIDPVLSELQITSNPIPNEISNIIFSYLANGSSTDINQIIFHANLTSTDPGITPELKNYRVKML